MKLRSRVAACATSVLLGYLAAAPSPVRAADRVALVIGNGAYDVSPRARRLRSPVNDASAVAAALERLGFDVTLRRDARVDAMDAALRAFERAGAGADVALVFYAGHGMTMDGVNYLVPVDARLERGTRVRFETVPLDDVLASTEGAGLRVVVLHACWNGWFVPVGLEEERLLVAYAETVAPCGEGKHSPYTRVLLAHLEQPGVEVGLMFRNVMAAVRAQAGDRNRYFFFSSLLDERYLAGAPQVDAAPGTEQSGGAASAPARARLTR